MGRHILDVGMSAFQQLKAFQQPKGHIPKTLTIQIQSADEAMEESPKAQKSNADRRPPRRDSAYVTSVEAARNLLTSNRLALLRTIRNKRPGSIYELAKII